MNHGVLANSSQGVSAALAEWLSPIKWQTFGTFEFPWNARPETAGRKFDEMINHLEREMRTRLCFVRAAETRAKSGASVPLHFHAAMTATKPISRHVVTDLWNTSVGRAGGDLALVVPYDPVLGGVAYITKQVADHACEWECRNVHLFTHSITPTGPVDHASLRSMRRWQAQNGLAPGQVVALGHAA